MKHTRAGWGLVLAMAAAAGWAVWKGWDDGRGGGAAAVGRGPGAVVSRGERSIEGRVAIPSAKEEFSFSPYVSGKDPVENEEEVALKEKVAELVKARGETPRAQARKRALGQGFRAVNEHRAPMNATRLLLEKAAEEHMAAKRGGSGEEQEAARKAMDPIMEKMKGMGKTWLEYRTEWTEWQKTEQLYVEVAARADIKAADGKMPPVERVADVAGAVGDAMLNAGYRAAAERMAAGDFSGAARGFAEVAGTAQGRFQEDARWNGMLAAMAAGEEGMVTEAARELLRGSASTAAFAMAALAMRDGEWEEAQIWVDQAAAEGDAGENEALGNALRGMGWMVTGGMRVAGPP